MKVVVSIFFVIFVGSISLNFYNINIIQENNNLLSVKLEQLNKKLVSSGKIIPADSVAYFNLNSCPLGWSAFKAGVGRFTIALNSDESDRGVYALGDTGGEEVHRLTKQELPRHTHVYSDWYYEDRGKDPEFATGHGDDVGIRFDQKRRTEPEGNNKPHNNMPPYIALLQCIKL